MARQDLHYELSPEADNDLEEIFDYTEREFGLDQAIAYVAAFDNVLENSLK